MTRTPVMIGAASAALFLAACNRPASTTDQVAAPATASAAATAASATPAPPMGAADFVNAAAGTDMFELTAAKQALKRSTNAEVKKFAQMMIDDHTKSTASLKAAIKSSGQSLALPTALPADMQSKVDDLTKSSAADFDKTYIGQQVDAHQAALTVMQGYAQNGDAPALKTFASDVAPVVQRRLTEAQRLQGTMK